MIWCVEDDASIRDIEVYTLSSTGFDARGFADGVSFWSALQTEKPDLVVLDVMLPGVDGIELLQRMKASAELRTILNDPAAPLLRIIRADALETLLASGADNPIPWYGQLMTTPQTIAWFLQLNYWLAKYKVELV